MKAWDKRRVIGSIRIGAQFLYLSEFSSPGGEKNLSVSLSRPGNVARGVIVGPFMARNIRDLFNLAIREIWPDEGSREARERARYLEFRTTPRKQNDPRPEAVFAENTAKTASNNSAKPDEHECGDLHELRKLDKTPQECASHRHAP